MPKTNGCLVAGMCLRAYLGVVHCEHTCDSGFLDQLKTDIFLSLMSALWDRAPRYLQKRLRSKLSEISFPELTINNSENSGVDQ